MQRAYAIDRWWTILMTSLWHGHATARGYARLASKIPPLRLIFPAASASLVADVVGVHARRLFATTYPPRELTAMWVGGQIVWQVQESVLAAGADVARCQRPIAPTHLARSLSIYPTRAGAR